MELLFAMICAHALCDYPLQGDFLAKGKNHTAPIPGIPWQHCLTAHAAIHAGAVLLITGSVFLATLELLAHTVIDYAKCDGRIGYHTDQALHILCKVMWLGLILMGAA